MRFTVLGPLRIADAGDSVDLRPSKLTSLLAALLVRPDQPGGPDYLHAAVWDEAAPERMKATLQTYVMRLRRVFRDFGLADEVITTTPAGYRIAVDPSSLDLLEFRSLARAARDAPTPEGRLAGFRDALAVWTVPPTTATPLPNVHSELLHRDHVPGLIEEWKQVSERRFDLELELGDCRAAVTPLRVLTRCYPAHERFAAQLIEALYRCERQHEALQEYGRVRETLCAELGLDPGEALRRLELTILRGEPIGGSVPRLRVVTVDEPGRGPTPAPAAGAPGLLTALPHRVPHFVGRAFELAALQGFLAPESGGGVGVVTGPPGIGKSTFAAVVAHSIADRFPGGSWYRSCRESPADPGTHASTPQPFETTDRPRLVVLEDPSCYADVLPYLPRVPGSSTLVTTSSGLPPLLARHAASIVRLQPLDENESGRLLAALIGSETVADDPAGAARLVELCGGFPAAVVIAASRLRMSRDRDLDSFVRWLSVDPVRRLSTSHDATMSLRGLVTDHLEQQCPVTSRAFLRFAHHLPSGPLDGFAATPLLGLDAGDAEVALEHLVEANLLEVDSAGHYSMHALLQAVGASLPPDAGSGSGSGSDSDQQRAQLRDARAVR